MGIEIKITGTDAFELRELIGQLNVTMNPVVVETTRTETATVEAPKPRKTKAKIEAEPIKEENYLTRAADDLAEEVTEERPRVDYAENTVTYDDVKAAVNKLAVACGREAVLAALQQLGVDHCNKLEPSQWAEAVALFTSKLEG